MNESPVMSQISEGALRGNEPSPTGVNEVPLSPQAPITQYSPQSWMSTPRSVQTPRSIQTNEDDSHVTPMDLNADFLLERGGKKLKKTRTNSKKSKKSRKTRTNSKKSKKSRKTRTKSKKSKKTRTYYKKSRKYNKRGGKGFTTSETNGKESQ